MLSLYAGWASAYDAEMEGLGWQTPNNVANIVKEVVDPPKDARILDVAAGRGMVLDGLFLIWIRRCVCQLVGWSVSPL